MIIYAIRTYKPLHTPDISKHIRYTHAKEMSPSTASTRQKKRTDQKQLPKQQLH